MDSADLASLKPDLYSAGVEGCAGKDVLDYSFREAASSLGSLQDDRNRQPGMNIFPVLAVQKFSKCILVILLAVLAL
jgi:hypothetical protein